MRKIKILVLLLFLSSNFLFSQNKVEISAGLGIPELLNLKIKYGNSLQLCGSIGFAPIISFWAFSTDFYYHFPTKSTEDKIKKWYLNFGVSYFPPSQSFSSVSKKTILMYSRVGKSFYFNKMNCLTGLAIDLGIMFQIWTNEKYSYGPHLMVSSKTMNSPVIGPAASICYFFKL
jgi:hypothetical protein